MADHSGGLTVVLVAYASLTRILGDPATIARDISFLGEAPTRKFIYFICVQLYLFVADIHQQIALARFELLGIVDWQIGIATTDSGIGNRGIIAPDHCARAEVSSY